MRETLVISNDWVYLGSSATTLVLVAGQGGADDDLIGIGNPTDGQVICLMPAAGHRVTVRQDTSAGGNILIPTGQAIGDNPWDTLMLVYNDNLRGWFRVGGSDYTP